MPEELDASIVIVHYRTLDVTANCIRSILSAPPEVSHEIIVVDNASHDGSVDWLEEHFPQVTLIRSLRNAGVAAGNNIGISAAARRYVLLLNSDTIVLPGSIDTVARFMDSHPEAAGVGGNLVDADGSFQASYSDFPSLWQEVLHATGLGRLVNPSFPSHGRGDAVREVDWIGSAFMLFRREALIQVGLVDEAYFMYGDETDLQYRLKQAGWRIYYLPDVDTVHLGGMSGHSSSRRRLIYRGHMLFFEKHRGRFQTAVLRLLFATTSAAKLCVWTLVGLMPGRRKASQREIQGHAAVLRLCAGGHTARTSAQ